MARDLEAMFIPSLRTVVKLRTKCRKVEKNVALIWSVERYVRAISQVLPSSSECSRVGAQAATGVICPLRVLLAGRFLTLRRCRAALRVKFPGSQSGGCLSDLGCSRLTVSRGEAYSPIDYNESGAGIELFNDKSRGPPTKLLVANREQQFIGSCSDVAVFQQSRRIHTLTHGLGTAVAH